MASRGGPVVLGSSQGEVLGEVHRHNLCTGQVVLCKLQLCREL